MRRTVLLALAFLTLSCGPSIRNHWVDETLRPNTLELRWISVDSVAIGKIVTSMQNALPKEQAMCLVGNVKMRNADSLMGVLVTDAYPAHEDSADARDIWFPTIGGGCRLNDGKTVGVSHSHPGMSSICTHSDADAGLVWGAPQILFSLVVCLPTIDDTRGEGEVLWQDGRRDEFVWRL